jgi:xanthine/uracil/vitamin C permease (AzgA family)
MTDDSSAAARAEEEKVSAAMVDSKMASLFDVRLVVGGLLTVYGVVLLIMGITDGSDEVQKAAGLRINLWTGIAMLVVGVLFLLWMRVRPLHVEPQVGRQPGPEESGRTDAPGAIRR